MPKIVVYTKKKKNPTTAEGNTGKIFLCVVEKTENESFGVVSTLMITVRVRILVIWPL